MGLIFKLRIFDSDKIAIRDLLDSRNHRFLRPNVPFLAEIFKFLDFLRRELRPTEPAECANAFGSPKIPFWIKS